MQKTDITYDIMERILQDERPSFVNAIQQVILAKAVGNSYEMHCCSVIMGYNPIHQKGINTSRKLSHLFCGQMNRF